MEPSSPSRFLDRRTPPSAFTLILLAGLSALGMNIFLPSLPRMTEYFDTQYSIMQLSVALYLGVSGLLQIVIGPISDNIGRRPVIMAGLFLFMLATLGCIYAPNVELFLFFRMCQAVIATAMALSRAAVRDMFPQDKAASMIGYVTMGMAIVPMIGPAIGGALDEAFGWQSTFWLLILLAALTLWLTWADFGETARKSGLTLTAQFREYPELARSPRFWGYSIANTASSGAFFAYLGGGPFVGAQVYGLTPAQLGLYFGAPAVGYFIGNFLTGRFATRFGINRMILAGSITLIVGVGLNIAVTLLALDSALSFFTLITLMGLGNGLAIPNATAGALSVRPHLAGTASGLSGALSLAGGAALSGWAGLTLVPGSTAMPLLVIMFLSSVICLLAIWLVIVRERQLGL